MINKQKQKMLLVIKQKMIKNIQNPQLFQRLHSEQITKINLKQQKKKLKQMMRQKIILEQKHLRQNQTNYKKQSQVKIKAKLKEVLQRKIQQNQLQKQLQKNKNIFNEKKILLKKNCIQKQFIKIKASQKILNVKNKYFLTNVNVQQKKNQQQLYSLHKLQNQIKNFYRQNVNKLKQQKLRAKNEFCFPQLNLIEMKIEKARKKKDKLLKERLQLKHNKLDYYFQIKKQKITQNRSTDLNNQFFQFQNIEEKKLIKYKSVSLPKLLTKNNKIETNEILEIKQKITFN